MAQDNFISAQQIVEKLTESFREHERIVANAAETYKDFNNKVGGIPSDYVKTLKRIKDEQDKIVKSTTQLEKTERQLQRQRIAELKLAAKRERAFDKQDRQMAREARQRERAMSQQKKQNREYVKLSTALNNVRNEAKDVAAAMFNLERQGRETSDEYKTLEVRFKRLSATTNILDKGLKDIDKSLGQHQREVGKYKISTENLHPALGRVNSQLAMMGLSLDDLAAGGKTSFKQLGAAITNFGRATLTFLLSPIGLAITALGGLFLLIRSNKDTVLEFDNGLKNVGKTTGLSAEQLSALGDDIIDLSRKLKTIGTESLLEYATVAGQLGVKGSENILAFTEALAKLETASDISGEEGGSSIARLLTLTDGGVDNIKDFGDEIVNLGNNFAATEKEILGNATTIAQSTAMYKFGRQNVLAYATATKALGIESEISGSSLGNMLSIFEKAIRTGKGLEAILELTGKTEKELATQFKTDAAGALTDYFTALNRVANEGGSVPAELEKIGLVARRDKRVVESLATEGYQTLALALDQVGASVGSLDKEFTQANQKLTNQAKTFGNAWDNLVLTIEDGEGVFSRFFSWLSGLGADFLNGITDSINSFEDAISGAYGPLDSMILLLDSFESSSKRILPILNIIPSFFDEQAESIKNQGKALEQSNQRLKEHFKATDENTRMMTAYTEELDKAIVSQTDWNAVMKGLDPTETDKRAGSIASLTEEISKLEDEIQQLETTDIKGVRTRQTKIKQLQDELDAILGITKAVKKQREQTSLADVEALRAEKAIELQQKIVDNEKNTAAGRLIANEDLSKKLIEQERIRYEKEKSNKELNDHDLEILEIEHRQRLLDIREAAKSRGEKIAADEIKRRLDIQREIFEGTISLMTQQGEEELSVLKSQLETREISIEEYEERAAAIKIRMAKAAAKAQLILLREELKIRRAAGEDVSALMQKISEQLMAIDSMTAEEFIKNQKKITDQVKKETAERQRITRDAFAALPDLLGVSMSNIGEIFIGIQDGFKDAGEAAQMFGQLMVEVSRAINAAENQRLDEQLQRLEEQRNVELEYAGQSAAARGEIEERFTEKKREIQQRQAKNNKEAAIIESIISTAVAVVKALQLPPPAGLILAGVVGAIGAAQTAIISAQPLPQFEKGVRGFEGGHAIINEKRQEVVTTPDGGVFRPKGKNLLVDLPKGANVYASEQEFNRELNQMLSVNGISNIEKPRQSEGMSEAAMYRAIKRAMSGNSESSITFDKKGFTTFIVNEQTKTVVRNNRVTFKGRNVR